MRGAPGAVPGSGAADPAERREQRPAEPGQPGAGSGACPSPSCGGVMARPGPAGPRCAPCALSPARSGAFPNVFNFKRPLCRAKWLVLFVYCFEAVVVSLQPVAVCSGCCSPGAEHLEHHIVSWK